MNVFTVQQEASYCFKENLGLVFMVLAIFSIFYDILLTRHTLQQSALGEVAGAVKRTHDNSV